jgi:hypothetical protein
LFVALVGCSYAPARVGGIDPDGPLSPLEAGMMFDCTTWPFAPAEVAPCDAPLPMSNLDVDGAFVLDSDTGVLTGPSGRSQLPYVDTGAVGVVSVGTFAVQATGSLRGVGTRPLAILAWSDTTIAGRIDVSTSIAGGLGAGSNVGCSVANQGLVGVGQSAGGGGGGFGADGGDGGDGSTSSGGNGGNARARPAAIEGGCDGADAGVAISGTTGTKGFGGGAIAVISQTHLEVSGVVHAGGGGGIGGFQGENGGGGGGSGGMIKLEANDLFIIATTILAANGGQGGGGCRNGTGGTGVDGTPNASEPAQGNSEGGGSDGGGGGCLAHATGNDASDSGRGAGGGGGGVGHIAYKGHANANVQSATMSPPGIEF